MAKLECESGNFETLWASDINFDGIRLEVYDSKGQHWFNVSVPDVGIATVNTFSDEVPFDVVNAALGLASQRP